MEAKAEKMMGIAAEPSDPEATDRDLGGLCDHGQAPPPLGASVPCPKMGTRIGPAREGCRED